MEIKPGTKLYSVATGRIDPLMESSVKAIQFVKKRRGFVGVQATEDGNFTLWLFDTIENAIGARTQMRYRGIAVGKNICEFEVEDDETISFKGVAAGKDKGKGYENYH